MSSTRSVLLVIPLAGIALVVTLGIAARPEPSYLDAWWNPFQGKSPHSLANHSLAIQQETVTIGRLIALQTNPAEWPAERIEELSLHIVLKSREYNLSPFLVLSLIHVESSFRPGAVSPAGAVGLMQLMPTTAQEVALSLGLDLSHPNALVDPKTNIDLGIRYIQHLKASFNSDEHILTAYNIGPAALRKKIKSGGQLPRAYYEKVMSAMDRYQRASRASRPAPKARAANKKQAKGFSTWL